MAGRLLFQPLPGPVLMSVKMIPQTCFSLLVYFVLPGTPCVLVLMWLSGGIQRRM